MSDEFREMARLPLPPLDKADREELIRLAEHAEMALRSGLPLPCYLGCDWLTRRAFIAASDSLRGLAAQRAGLASLGPMGAALAGADADGGAAADEVFLEQQTSLALGNIQAEKEAHLRGA